MAVEKTMSDELAGIAQKAARGGMFLLVGNASSTIILGVGSIIIARLLGPSSYGSYSLVTVFPLLLVAFADVGLSSALVRFPARFRAQGDLDRASRAIVLAFLFKTTISIAASLICYSGANTIAAAILNRADLAPLVQLSSALILLRSLYDSAVYSFIGLDLMQFSGSLQVLQSILKSIVAPLLILIGLGVAGAISGYLFGLAVASMVGLVILFMRYARFSGQASNSASMELIAMLSYSLPLYLGVAASVFTTQYQNIVLAHFVSDLEIGNFNAASNFTMLLAILSAPISMAMFPMFSKLGLETHRDELTQAFGLSSKYVSFLMIPAAVATMALSRDIVYVIYGTGYLLAPNYLIAICSFYLLSALSYFVVGGFLGGVGDTMTVLKMDLFQLVVFLPLGPVLTWFWGVYGLVIAYVVANGVGTAWGLRRASLRFGVPNNLGANARILIAASAAAIPTVLLLQVHLTETPFFNLIVGGLIYLMTYLTLAPLLGALNGSDIDNLKTVFYRISPLARLAKPILTYESWIISATERD